MLLKHQLRNQPKYNEGGNISIQERTANQIRLQQVQGTYMSKDQRLEKKMEVQKAHFSLGDANLQMPKKSYGQALIDQSVGQINTDNEQVLQRLKLVENSRKNNFKIGSQGNSGDPVVSTSSQTYVPYLMKNYQKQQQKPSSELKAANFKLGSQNFEYVTTNNDTFNEQILKESKLNQTKDEGADKEELLKKNRQQQFTYGSDQVNYISTAKGSLVKHQLDPTAVEARELNSQKLKESHLVLGNDGGVIQQQSQINQSKWRCPTPKTSDVLGIKNLQQSKDGSNKISSAQQNAQINFSIGQQKEVENQFLSLNRQAAESIKKTGENYQKNAFTDTQIEQLKEMKADVRKSHFHLGNNEIQYVSTAGNALVEYPITEEEVRQKTQNRINQKDKMRQANFKLQNQKLIGTEQSTYRLQISNIVEMDQLAPGRAELLTNLKQSSINIGAKLTKQDYITEQAHQYLPPQQSFQESQAKNLEIKQYLKGHHFDIAWKNQKLQSISAQGSSANNNTLESGVPHYLNDISAIESFKKDQRASHFKMGYDELRPITAKITNENKENQTQRQYGSKTLEISSGLPQIGLRFPNLNKPQIYSTKNQIDQKQLKNLVERNRSSNIVYGQGKSQVGNGVLKTSNQAYQKWIQPVK